MSQKLTASATKNPYKIGSIRVTLSPVKKKEEVLWVAVQTLEGAVDEGV